MDFIEFEKVSLADIKAQMHEEREAVKVPERDWTSVRSPQLPSDLKLQHETGVWILSLPDDIRPLRLARQFPRVANNIARAWHMPSTCEKVLDELMLDHRGTRQGFPEAVALEIGRLRTYHTNQLYAQQKQGWDEIREKQVKVASRRGF